MIRLNVVCEGPTESTIVKNILSHHLATFDVGVGAPMVGTSGKKGGAVTLKRLRENVRDCLLQDRNSYCTTFVDFYGIDGDFPGKKEAARKSSLSDKQGVVCDTFSDALAQMLDVGPMRRFIPYVQMHEFEGLLFSDPDQLASELRRQDLAQKLWEIRRAFETPEHINDSPVTAPSKRLQSLEPRYRKVQVGERAAKAITLDAIRQQCPLFDDWLAKLEKLPPLPA
ncbi:MAG: DUF4276 family protein [Chloroflexi bacterium]|nr:DUF4276 family protein [Chloroflexota bacterium]